MTIRELDKNRCRKKRCGCRDNLEEHHIVPKGHGGTEEPWNLITLCNKHHESVTSKKITNIQLLSELKDLEDFRWGKALEWHLMRETLRNLRRKNVGTK